MKEQRPGAADVPYWVVMALLMMLNAVAVWQFHSLASDSRISAHDLSRRSLAARRPANGPSHEPCGTGAGCTRWLARMGRSTNADQREQAARRP